MQGFQKTQTQLKFSTAKRKTEPIVSPSPSRRGGGNETFELNIFKKNPSPVTIVDDMTYRRSARIIAALDILYSTFLLFAQLLSLITGAAHDSTPASPPKPTTAPGGRRGTLSSSDTQPSTEMALATKQLRENLAVLVWTGMFAVFILQLVVAGALYGGTYERDGRKCMRNCRIWCVTTIFLVFLLVVKVLVLAFFGDIAKHFVKVGFLVGEISFRIVGLIFINKFIKELSFEFADEAGDQDDGQRYEQLCPPSPVQLNNHLKPIITATHHV